MRSTIWIAWVFLVFECGVALVVVLFGFCFGPVVGPGPDPGQAVVVHVLVVVHRHGRRCRSGHCHVPLAVVQVLVQALVHGHVHGQWDGPCHTMSPWELVGTCEHKL